MSAKEDHTLDDPHGGGWLSPASRFIERRAQQHPSTERDRELKNFHVKIPALLLERLSAYSVTEGRTRTSAIRMSIHSWLEERGY